jgi:hypothetical protein
LAGTIRDLARPAKGAFRLLRFADLLQPVTGWLGQMD